MRRNTVGEKNISVLKSPEEGEKYQINSKNTEKQVLSSYKYFFGEPDLLRLYTTYARRKKTWKPIIIRNPVQSLDPPVDKAGVLIVSFPPVSSLFEKSKQ